jgi:hypothetical protein
MVTPNALTGHTVNGNGVDRNVKAKKFLDNPTAVYRPGGAWWGFPSAVLDGNPVFTFWDIPRMLRDPRVRFVERMWRAPFQRVKWAVKAEDQRVAKFVGTQLRRFWRNSLPKILSRYFRYGYAPGGAEYCPYKSHIRIDKVRSVEPRDARPLLWSKGPYKGQPAGFLMQSTGSGSPWSSPGSNEVTGQGQTWVQAPHAFWFAGYGEFGPYFDAPPMSGMFEPWLEKRGRGGAIHARRLWFRKCAFRGGSMRHPSGTSRAGDEQDGIVRNNQDIARELMEGMESGAVLIASNEANPDPGMAGKYAWDFTEAAAQPDVKGVREYPQDLDSEMLEGVGIPRDALESTEVGSGWSGKVIPLMGFLGGVDELAGLAIEAADTGWLRHLVALNFSRDVYYEIEAQSLAEEVQQAAKSGKGGGEGPNPLAGMFTGQPPPAGPPGGNSVSLSTFDESKHHRDHGKFSSQQGAGATATERAPESHEDSKAKRIIRALKNLPRKAVKKAKAKAADAYGKLESRYGPGYAKVIVRVAMSGIPVPVPGAMVASGAAGAAIMAVAELHLRLKRWGSPDPESIDHEGVVKPAARWFLSRIFGRLRTALHLSTFDESQHPRDDSGRFIDKNELREAKKNPDKAAELREQVSNPKEREKLDRAIGKPESPDKAALRARGKVIVSKIIHARREGHVNTIEVDDVRELIDSIPHMSLEELRGVRNALGADLVHGRSDQTKRDLVPKLVDHAEKVVTNLEAREKAQAQPTDDQRDPSAVVDALLGRDDEVEVPPEPAVMPSAAHETKEPADRTQGDSEEKQSRSDKIVADIAAQRTATIAKVLAERAADPDAPAGADALAQQAATIAKIHADRAASLHESDLKNESQPDPVLSHLQQRHAGSRIEPHIPAIHDAAKRIQGMSPEEREANRQAALEHARTAGQRESLDKPTQPTIDLMAHQSLGIVEQKKRDAEARAQAEAEAAKPVELTPEQRRGMAHWSDADLDRELANVEKQLAEDSRTRYSNARDFIQSGIQRRKVLQTEIALRKAGNRITPNR